MLGASSRGWQAHWQHDQLRLLMLAEKEHWIRLGGDISVEIDGMHHTRSPDRQMDFLLIDKSFEVLHNADFQFVREKTTKKPAFSSKEEDL